MNKKVLHGIEKSRAKVIIFDIDGTLKDLCKEHNTALRYTLEIFNVGNIRTNLVLTLNKLAMFMVKTGLFPTNSNKQNILIKIFALFSGVNSNYFSNVYFKNYSKQLYLFKGTNKLLSNIGKKQVVYFATINKQNYNLEQYGIPSDRIVYTKGIFKLTTYRDILKSINVQKKDVIIVGDNLFDDIISAKLLGVKCLLVNHYNSKLKKLFCGIVNRNYQK